MRNSKTNVHYEYKIFKLQKKTKYLNSKTIISCKNLILLMHKEYFL